MADKLKKFRKKGKTFDVEYKDKAPQKIKRKKKLNPRSEEDFRNKPLHAFLEEE